MDSLINCCVHIGNYLHCRTETLPPHYPSLLQFPSPGVLYMTTSLGFDNHLLLRGCVLFVMQRVHDSYLHDQGGGERGLPLLCAAMPAKLCMMNRTEPGRMMMMPGHGAAHRRGEPGVVAAQVHAHAAHVVPAGRQAEVAHRPHVDALKGLQCGEVGPGRPHALTKYGGEGRPSPPAGPRSAV